MLIYFYILITPVEGGDLYLHVLVFYFSTFFSFSLACFDFFLLSILQGCPRVISSGGQWIRILPFQLLLNSGEYQFAHFSLPLVIYFLLYIGGNVHFKVWEGGRKKREF